MNNMGEESKGMNPRTWTAISVGVLLIAIAIGIILYVVTEDILNTFATILLVYGLYMAVMSFAKKGGESNFGPSESDAALAAGAVTAGTGAACFAYSFSDSVYITVAVLIIVLAVVGIVMAVKNRNV